MPVEIKELRLNINVHESEQVKNQTNDHSNMNLDIENLVDICVERVFQELEDREGR